MIKCGIVVIHSTVSNPNCSTFVPKQAAHLSYNNTTSTTIESVLSGRELLTLLNHKDQFEKRWWLSMGQSNGSKNINKNCDKNKYCNLLMILNKPNWQK